MDIGSGKTYPSNALSNFSPHPFIIDGVKCNSMEGFLQSLKFKNIEMQRHVCTLVGKSAKFKGKKKKWWRTQTLWWNGIELKRDGKLYQMLLDRAFKCLAENEGFKKALLSTNNAVLKHSIGNSNPSRTVLTEREFCSRLMKLREEIK